MEFKLLDFFLFVKTKLAVEKDLFSMVGAWCTFTSLGVLVV